MESKNRVKKLLKKIDKWRILIICSVLFWLWLIKSYWDFYQPIIKLMNSIFDNYSGEKRIKIMFVILEKHGASLSYIWYRLMQIGLAAIGSIAAIMHLKDKK
jgi:hypothetical protein